MIRMGTFFKHKTNKDICYEVIKCHGPYNGRYKLKTRIWNMGYTHSWVLVNNFKRELAVSDWVDYYSIPPEVARISECLRHEDWK